MSSHQASGAIMGTQHVIAVGLTQAPADDAWAADRTRVTRLIRDTRVPRVPRVPRGKGSSTRGTPTSRGTPERSRPSAPIGDAA
jgi:hypothetical protein